MIGSQDTTTSELRNGSLIRHATLRLRFTTPVDEGLTFRLCISEGQIIIYASTTPNPSNAQYERRDEVSADRNFPCLSIFYETQSEGIGRRKRRQALSDSTKSTSLYISLEGQDDMNVFSFNSSEGNVTLGKIILEGDDMTSILCVLRFIVAIHSSTYIISNNLMMDYSQAHPCSVKFCH